MTAKTFDKRVAFPLLLLAILFAMILFYYYDGKSYSYTHTKAICDNNTCRDYLITCDNDIVVDIAPISGFVTFPEDWIDSREIDDLCTH